MLQQLKLIRVDNFTKKLCIGYLVQPDFPIGMWLFLKPVKICGPTAGSLRTHQLLQQILLQCFSVDSTDIAFKVKPPIPQWGQKVGGFDSTASVPTQFFQNLLNLSRAYSAS